mgnify:CR=1 FL=1
MSMGHEQKSVENVINALVAALTDDKKKLCELLDVLYTERWDTGFGYIMSNAIACVEEKVIQKIMSHQPF